MDCIFGLSPLIFPDPDQSLQLLSRIFEIGTAFGRTSAHRPAIDLTSDEDQENSPLRNTYTPSSAASNIESRGKERALGGSSRGSRGQFES